MTEFSH